jgi:uncharacterized protein (TIGR02597 family)
VSVTVPANSDAVLAVPLNRAAVFKGVIQSISGNVITVAGTSPAWTTDQFVQMLPGQVNTYALQLASGSKNGLTGKITANGANTITVQLDPAENLTGVQTEAADGTGKGDHIDILPFWTPVSLITSAVSNGSQILLLESTTAGVNLSSSGSYGYDSGSWVDENTFQDANHSPLAFSRSFIFRNAGAATTISIAGSVPMNKHRIVIRSYGAGDQDIAIGFSSPVPTPIGSIGLNFTEDDQLLVFNNSAVGQNKSASQVLYYTTADGWVNESFQPVGSTFMLQPPQGYIFRKKATGAAGSFVYTALQSYLTP